MSFHKKQAREIVSGIEAQHPSFFRLAACAKIEAAGLPPVCRRNFTISRLP